MYHISAKHLTIKGIFSDSKNIWHKSDDIDNKRLFPKFQSILIFGLQVMHDYVAYIVLLRLPAMCLITMLFSDTRLYAKNALISL